MKEPNGTVCYCYSESYDYKMFLACKIPTSFGNLDLIKAMWSSIEMEVTFNTGKYLTGNRVIFVVTILKSEALFQWVIMRFFKGAIISKSMY